VLFKGRAWHRGPRKWKPRKRQKPRQKPDNQPMLPFE
jgi:hypothetical protein